MRYRSLLAPFACALLVLFMAFGVTSGVQKPTREPVTVDALAQSGSNAVFDELFEQDSIPRYVDKSVIPTTEDAQDVAYYHGNGVGGGDMAETEPNNAMDSADSCHDIPFDCAGTIQYVGDADMSRVVIGSGMRIDAYAFKDIGNFHSVLDPMLFVYNSDGTLLTWNDDMQPGLLSSHAVFTAPYTGLFYFRVVSAMPVGGAQYRYLLSVFASPTEVFSIGNLESEPNNLVAQADPLPLPGAKVGNIFPAGDSDFTFFNVPSNTTVVVDLHSAIYGQSLDAVVNLFSASGQLLWSSDDMDSRDPRFNLVISDAGAYVLRVTDYYGHGGGEYAYVLTVTPQDIAGSPLITTLKFNGSGLLKQVKGSGFVAGGSVVEVETVTVPSQTSANKPTTQIKVKPPVEIPTDHFVTVRNPSGRRSNVLVP